MQDLAGCLGAVPAPLCTGEKDGRRRRKEGKKIYIYARRFKSQGDRRRTATPGRGRLGARSGAVAGLERGPGEEQHIPLPPCRAPPPPLLPGTPGTRPTNNKSWGCRQLRRLLRGQGLCPLRGENKEPAAGRGRGERGSPRRRPSAAPGGGAGAAAQQPPCNLAGSAVCAAFT